MGKRRSLIDWAADQIISLGTGRVTEDEVEQATRLEAERRRTGAQKSTEARAAYDSYQKAHPKKS